MAKFYLKCGCEIDETEFAQRQHEAKAGNDHCQQLLNLDVCQKHYFCAVLLKQIAEKETYLEQIKYLQDELEEFEKEIRSECEEEEIARHTEEIGWREFQDDLD